VEIRRVWLRDFRSYESAEVALSPGLTVVEGPNGVGKTNLLEAIAYLATRSSFRGAPPEALVRAGCDEGVVRAEVVRDGRELLIEASIRPAGRGRVQINRQRITRNRELLDALRVTVFSPDDLELVKGGPSSRRHFLDDLLVALHPRNDSVRTEFERVVRQRNALLKQSRGRLTAEIETTLGVWDTKMIAAGEALAEAREATLGELRPIVAQAYDSVARAPAHVAMRYEAPWRDESEITPDASFVKDLGIDSLDYAELVMEFEQSFNIKISDDDAEKLQTIGQAVSYIEGKVRATSHDSSK
jgi:DNA replication and repair protein RecF